MGCLALPVWDVGWLIWGTDQSSVTLSLSWVMSCSTTAVDLWVMDKVFIGKKLWKTLPWEAPKQICSRSRATWKARLLPRGLTVALREPPPNSVYSHCTRNVIISTVCFSHQFSTEVAIECTQNWKVAFPFFCKINMFLQITRLHCNRDLIHCAALL